MRAKPTSQSLTETSWLPPLGQLRKSIGAGGMTLGRPLPSRFHIDPGGRDEVRFGQGNREPVLPLGIRFVQADVPFAMLPRLELSRLPDRVWATIGDDEVLRLRQE